MPFRPPDAPAASIVGRSCPPSHSNPDPTPSGAQGGRHAPGPVCSRRAPSGHAYRPPENPR